MLRRSRVVSSRKDVALVSQAYPTISTVGGTFGLSSSSHMVRPAVQGHIGLATAAFFAIAPTMRLSCELAASFCISERQRVACLCSRDLQSIVNGSIWRATLPDEVRPIHFLRSYTPTQMMDKVRLRFNIPVEDEVRGRRVAHVLFARHLHFRRRAVLWWRVAPCRSHSRGRHRASFALCTTAVFDILSGCDGRRPARRSV